MKPIGNKQYVLQQRGDHLRSLWLIPIKNKQYVLHQKGDGIRTYETDRE